MGTTASGDMLVKIILEVQANQAQKAIDAVKKSLAGFDEQIKKTMPRYNMQALSFLFTGMAMKRAAESFFNFAFNGLEKYEGYQGAALDATMRLSAGWEFLRFSIFNALGQSELFQNLVTMLVNAFNWISQFVSKNPEIAGMVAAFMAVVGVLGGISMAGSVIYGLWQSIFWLSEWLAIKFAGSALETTFALATGAINGIVTLLKTAGVFYLIWDGWKNFKDGDIAGIFADIATAGIWWLAGFGYAVGFYLIYKGLDWGIGKGIENLGAEVAAKGPEYVVGAVKDAGLSPGGFWESLLDKLHNLLPNFTENLGYVKKGTDEVTSSLAKENGLNPNMFKLNKEFETSNKQTQSLIEKYPSLTSETDAHASSVDHLASAYERLAAARKAAADAENDEETSSVTG